MKKISLYLFAILSIAFLPACGSNNRTSPTKTARSAAKIHARQSTFSYTDVDMGEALFDYAVSNDEYRYMYSEYKRDKTYFTNNFNFKPSCSQIINPDFFLNVTAINSFITTLSQSCGYDPSKNFAAIQMFFGMRNNTMVLVFSPVVLTPITIDGVQCTVTPSTLYYTSNIDGSTSALNSNSGSLTDLTSYYHDNVCITHPNAPTISDFIDGNLPDGDSHCAIIPIQQVLAMYADNTSSLSRKGTDMIQFDICASNLFINTGNPSNFKVHVISSYNLIKDYSNDGPRFQLLAADFTQMCPPACDDVSFVPARLSTKKGIKTWSLNKIPKLFHKHIVKNTH